MNLSKGYIIMPVSRLIDRIEESAVIVSLTFNQPLIALFRRIVDVEITHDKEL